jgi:fructokinase
MMIGETLVDIKENIAYPGGSTLNIAIATSRLGSKSFYLGKISGDKYGKQIENYLDDNNVLIERDLCNAKEETITANATIIEDKVEYTFEWKDSSTYSLTKEELNKYFFEHKDIGCVLIGSISLMLDPLGQIIEDFVMELDENIKVIVDPNVRDGFGIDIKQYRRRMLRLATRSNLIKMSDEDLHYLFPKDTQDKAIQSFLDTGVNNLIITYGKGGSNWYNENREIFHQDSFKGKMVDTIGCGDTFLGAVLAALDQIGYFKPDNKKCRLDSNEIQSIMKYASKAATINMGRSGCNPPTKKELQFEITH